MKQIRDFQIVPEGIANPGKQVDFLSVYCRRNIRTAHKKGPVGAGKQLPEIPGSRILPEYITGFERSANFQETELAVSLLGQVLLCLAVIVGLAGMIHAQYMVGIQGKKVFLCQFLKKFQVIGSGMEQ
jgi:hypothetical protein